MRSLVGAVLLTVWGCGGVGADPPPVAESEVKPPRDAPAAVAQLLETHKAVGDALGAPDPAAEIRKARPHADILAILAGKKLGPLASGLPESTAARLRARGEEIASEARKLADAMGRGDAAVSRVTHAAIGRLLERLQAELPRAGPPKGGN